MGLLALYLAVPVCTWLCLGLPYSNLPQTATDWLKCFCIYSLIRYINNGLGLDGTLNPPLKEYPCASGATNKWTDIYIEGYICETI